MKYLGKSFSVSMYNPPPKREQPQKEPEVGMLSPHWQPPARSPFWRNPFVKDESQ